MNRLKLYVNTLQGLAGGTLFYITFFEVLDKEKLSKGGMSGLLGFCFIFAGFAIMAAVNAMGKRDNFLTWIGSLRDQLVYQQ